MPLPPIDHTAEPADSAIAELFARDPMDLSSQDLDAIIAKLRAQRHRFVLGDMKAGRSPKKTTTPKLTDKQEAAVKAAGSFDLGDLGL